MGSTYFDASLDENGKPLTYLNVGTGKDISIKKLSEKIAKAIGYKGKILWDSSKPDGTHKKQLNINRILSMWCSPKIELDSGIRATVESYKKEYFFNLIYFFW